ncbi:MAG: SMP-30/gluconolactonase/LRE family protein [Acidimicrobiia bacterium]
MTERWCEGFAYPECPRWHDDALWFSDQHAGEVVRVDASGSPTVVHRVVSRPSGLGWRPDGSLLVVSMLDHRLLCEREGELSAVADFTGLHGGPTNDMVVDEFGRAYIGNIGFDFYAGESARPTVITMVDVDDRVSVVADDVVVPNGMVITSQHELVFAESWRHQLTRFAIADDGSLHDREVFADVGTDIPDGICIDAEDAVWYASLHDRLEVVRVARGGQVLDRVKTTGEAIACELGGVDGHTLFVCVSDDLRPETSVANRTGRIECARVDVPRRGH